MEIHLREVMATTKRMAQIIAYHSGRPLDQVEHDIDRDFFMTAEEARGYGLIDEVITPRRGILPADCWPPPTGPPKWRLGPSVLDL